MPGDCGIVARSSFKEIGAMVDKGLGTVWKTVVLFISSTSYFRLILFQGVCLVVTLIIAAICWIVEKKRGVGVFTDEEIKAIQSAPVDEKALALKRPKLFITNILLTVIFTGARLPVMPPTRSS